MTTTMKPQPLNTQGNGKNNSKGNDKENGEVDYDPENDILFFKLKGREYSKSIELDDLVVDLDQEGLVSGLQIFDAGQQFNLDVGALQNIHHWNFHVKVENKVITIQLTFELEKDDRIVERGQNVIRESALLARDSEVRCAMEA